MKKAIHKHKLDSIIQDTRHIRLLKIYAVVNLAWNILPTVIAVLYEAIHGKLSSPFHQPAGKAHITHSTLVIAVSIFFVILALLEVLWIRGDVILYKIPTLKKATTILIYFTVLSTFGVMGSFVPKVQWLYVLLNSILLVFTVYILFILKSTSKADSSKVLATKESLSQQ
jgi:hypothetical protein